MYVIKYTIPDSSIKSLTSPVFWGKYDTKKEAELIMAKLTVENTTVFENGKPLAAQFYIEEVIKPKKDEVNCRNMRAINKGVQVSGTSE
jgi:hypothetical protein